MSDDDSRNVGAIIGGLTAHDVTVARVVADDHWYQLVADIDDTLYRISCKPTIVDTHEGNHSYRIYTDKEERRRLFETDDAVGPDAFCFADGLMVYWVPADEMNKRSLGLSLSGPDETHHPHANPSAEYRLDVQLDSLRYGDE